MKKLLLFFAAAFSFLLISNRASAQTIAYSSPNVFTVGVAVNLVPTATGGTPSGCTLNIGTIPPGLTLNANGTITGTPTTVAAAANFRVRATNGGGHNSNTFTIQIVAAATLAYTNPAAYTVGTAIANLSPTTTTGIATGGFGAGTALAGATLSNPYGMATDAAGNVYVTNYGNNTVSEYSSAGTYVGVYGTGNPAYNQPSGIAFDASGNAYVANRATTGNGNVYKFNSSGVYQSTIITGLSRVYGIATDAAGNVYVADQNAGRVYKYSNTGTLLLTITLANSWNVAVDAAGNIYILNGNTRVSKYNAGGTLVSANYIAGLTNAFGLSIDANGSLYVGDSGTGSVTQYNSAGTLISTLNGLTDPEGMVADGKGDLYVSDRTNNTVTKYPPAGGYYITAGTLPAGLSFNTTTGTFSGTPTVYFTSTIITVTGYNAGGTPVNANVTLTCNLSAPALTYATGNIYTVGVPVTLTPTNTGGPPSSTTPTPALPAGLTISPTTGVISGTPTAPSALTTYSVSATNATGTTTSNNFTITVVNPPAFSYAGPQIYTVNTAITSLSPTVSSGGPLTGATISPALPAGLTMSAAGIISGTPTVTSAAATYTITATGTPGGTGTATVVISVVTAPVFSYAGPQTYTTSVPITSLSPTITSGGPLSGATVAPALPAGLSISAAGVISGTPTTVTASATYTITATGSNGGVGTATVVIKVVAPPVFTYASPQIYGQNVAITPLSPTGTGTPLTLANISPALPTGLTISATGVISGTPTVLSAAATYTITATGSNGGTGTATVVISVVTPPSFSYTGPDIYTRNLPISALSPTVASGGPLTGATINPALPAGLVISAAGVISGTPTANSGTTTYTITATGANGSQNTATVVISVVTAPVFAYATPQTYTVGVGITALSPTGTGTPLTGATISPALPAGLTMSATGVITGTPTAASAATNYTVTAVGSNGGTGTSVVRITVVTPPVFTYASPQVYQINATITPLSPTGTGTPLTGATISPALPAGLTMSATGVISGTPTALSAATVYTITATGSNGGIGTATVTISVVLAPPALTYTTPNTYGTGAAFTLTPTNTGSAVASSSILPALPAGVTMSATGVISGSSATAGTATYVVSATNAAGTTSSNSFVITFVAPPSISYTPSTNAYTVGTSIPTLTPANSGGAVATFAFGTGTVLTGATLSTPYGIGINPVNSDIYVTNSGSGTISYYTSAGAYVGTFYAAGFNTPVGIVFDAAGNAYVADRGTNDVYKITPALVRTVLVNGLTSLRGIAIDASNNLYVANGGNNQLGKYSTAGTLLFTINNNNYVSGAAVDGSGNIYVTGRNSGSVYKYNSSGTLISTFATGFNTPYAIAVDGSGNVYVSDTNNNQVKVYNSSGTLLTTVTGLNTPFGITVDGSGNLYVVNQGTPSVVKYPLVGGYTISSPLPSGLSFSTATGVISGTPAVAFASTTYTIKAYNAAGSGSTTVTLSCTFITPTISYSPSTNVYTAGTAITPLVPTTTGNGLGLPGFGSGTALANPTGPGGFNTPQGMAFDAAGNIYITDSNNSIIRKYSAAGAYIGTFGTGVPGGFNTPTGIVFDSSGNAYVVDAGNGVAYKLNAAGAYQATLNPRGGGGWGSAFAIAIDASNNLYVTDQFGSYVTKFSTSGSSLQTITTNLNQPGGVATDAAGNIYIEDTGNGQVYKYNSSGVYQSTIVTGLNTPYGLAIDGAGNIYVGDSGTGLVSEYNQSGTLLTTVGGQTDPEGIVVDKSGNMYVSDAANNTVIKYPPTGGFYLSGTLPPGLSFSSTTGTFTGTPTAAFPVTTYTVTAYSYGVAATTTVTLSCTITTPAFHYSPSTNVYSVGTSITPLVPIVTAGNIGAPGFSSGTALSGAALNTPQGIGTDAAGNIYVADSGTPAIRKYNSAGTYLGLFGTGIALNTPMGIVFDSAGNAYVLDQGTGVVYKYNAAGAYQATLNPRGGGGWGSAFAIAIDASNNLYVTDQFGAYITKFTTAGVSTANINTGPINQPAGIVVDASGNIYELDSGDGTIYKYNASGTYVSTVLTGLNFPMGLAIDGAGNFYVGDSGTGTIAEYNSSGTLITTVAGSTDPEGLYVNSSGDVFATDATNNTLTEYLPTGGYTLSGTLPAGLSFNNTTGTFSGTPTVAFPATTYTITGYSYGIAATTTVTLSCLLPLPAISYTPSTNIYCIGTAITALNPVNTGGAVSAMTYSAGTQITGATLSGPYGIGTDPSGNIYVTNSVSGTIVKFTSAGVYSSVFNTGLNTPVGIVFDSSGNAYVIDRGTTNVYKITPAGVRTTIITGVNSLRGIAIDASNNLYITSGGSNRIYKYTTAGGLTTTFPTTYTNYPTGVAVSPSGNVYVLDRTNNNVIEFSSTGTYITTLSVGANTAYGLSIDAAGNLYVADSGDNQIEVYNSLGTLLATITSNVSGPFGLIADSFGNIYVTNSVSNRLYKYIVTGNFTISPALPAGLAFNTATGGITGTPTALSAATVYTVSCSNATGPATTTVNLTVNTTPAFTYTTPDVYVANTAIATLSPTITAGAGTPTAYTVSPALPAGLSLNAATGAITGTPTTVTAAANYTVTGTNTCGIGTFMINITINIAAPVVAYPTPDVYTTGIAITPLNPNNTGGAATWSINIALPAGLIFDTTTGIITGTPTAISPATNYIVTAINTTATVTQTINITCNPPAPIISYTSGDVYNVGIAIPPLTPTNTGGPALTWSVSPALPAGLSIDPLTGIITGTPTTVTGSFGYVVTATNAGGSGSFTVTITIVSAAPVIAYTTPDVYTVGTAISPLIPTNSGGTPASYAISPGLPSGLNFDTTTGIISGTPTAVTAAANYVVTATNAGGIANFTINIACTLAGPVIAYTTPDIFPVGAAIAPLSPTNTGTAATGYTISAALPTGLNFDTTTGIISGTPTVTSPATNYTITATNGSGSGMTIVNITCTGYVDWIGVTSADWNNPANWATGAVPTATDIAGIGVNQTFSNFPAILVGAGTINVGAVVIGTSNTQVTAGTSAASQAGGVMVNTGSFLNVTGGITYQSDANSTSALIASISGPGSVTAAGINVTGNTSTGAPYTQTLTSSVNSLSLSSNVALTSSDVAGVASNAAFTVSGGTTSVAGTIQTTNTAAGTSTLSVIPGTTATLQLANAAPLAGLSGTGTNVVSFNNPGATIEYSGAGQTVYTDAGITGLAAGVSYTHIKFSGTGVKTPTGTNANNLNISGDFTNALTLNDASDYVDLHLPTVIFGGTTQNIYAGNGTGTKFYNVTVSSTGITTIQSGNAYVASNGLLVMSGASAVLAANGLLTLNSDVNGAATVAPIPTGCSITGNVNVQRFITGGNYNYRGYRLVSSPVYATTAGANKVYSVNYLINSVYLRGTNGVAGGFDAPGNPNIYLFRENLAPSNASFISGNFRGVSDISASPSYTMDIDGPGFNVPAGNGYMFFFRGDRNAASFTSESTTAYIPTSTILTATGTLNQGQVTVSDWYTPGSSNLGFTTTPGNGPVQGFNLVGNPYASSIDWDQFNTSSANTGIFGGLGGAGVSTNPFIYIIDPVSKNYNIYQSGFGGVGTIASSGSNVIPSGQGFFVVAPSATAQLVFNESAKVNTQANAANGNLFLGPPPVAAVVQYLHLKLYQDSVNTDGMLISFNSSARPQYNINEDAIYKPGNGTVSLASRSSDNIALAVNTLPLPSLKGAVIPLTVNALKDGNFQIKLESVKSVPVLYDFWLKDAYAKDSLDIRNNPSYAFTISHSDTTTYGANRFSLIIRQNPALMVHLLNFNALKIATGDQVIWTTENEQNYTSFTIQRSVDGGATFGVLGGVPSSGQGTYSLLDKAPLIGSNAYRLQMTDLNGAITYSKIVTIMYANTGNQVATNGFIVYPNPTAGPVNLTMNQVNAGQTYTIQIVNNLGAVIQTATSSTPNWNTDVSHLLPGTYFVEVKNKSTNAVVGKSAFVKL